MWTKDKLKEAAAQYDRRQIQYHLMTMIRDDYYEEGYDSDNIKKAFIAGAKYIIKNTQV